MDRTEVQFETLDRIAQKLYIESIEIDDLRVKTHRQLETLIEGQWIGAGADRFIDETYEVLLPALNRLSEALSEASKYVVKVSSMYQQAQVEAAEAFNTVAYDQTSLIASS